MKMGDQVRKAVGREMLNQKEAKLLFRFDPVNWNFQTCII